MWGSEVTVGVLSQDTGTLASSPPASCLPLGEQLCPTTFLHHDLLPQRRPKVMGSGDHGAELLNGEPKKPCLLQDDPSRTVSQNRKLRMKASSGKEQAASSGKEQAASWSTHKPCVVTSSGLVSRTDCSLKWILKVAEGQFHLGGKNESRQDTKQLGLRHGSTD